MKKKRTSRNDIETDDQGVMVSRGQADHHDQPARNAQSSAEYLRATQALIARQQNQHTPHEPLLIRQRDAATMLSVTPETLRNWHRKGLISPTKIGGVTGYRLEDLKRLVDRHVVQRRFER